MDGPEVVKGMGEAAGGAAPRTVEALVLALGGPGQVARQLGISVPAVCNWYALGQVPARHHVRLWRLARAAGLAWRPPGAEGLDLVVAHVAAHRGGEP